MQDRDLDKILEKWVDDEAASAPKLRPTAEMYEQVVSLGRKRSLGALFSRRLVWAASGAALIVFVLVSTLVYSSFLPTPGVQIAQRAAFALEKGPQRGAPPPKGKGPKGGSVQFEQLLFQVREAGSSEVRSVDLLAPQRPRIVLVAADSYRLVLEPKETRHISVYQQSPSGAVALLYPNKAYSSALNPVRAGETVYLPAEPNGFYLEQEEGTVRLYVVAAEEPMPGLQTLYERYSRSGLRLGRKKSLDLLLEQMDVLAGGQIKGASGWTFEFEVRQKVDRVE